jgi:C4-type Zn-finger protein
MKSCPNCGGKLRTRTSRTNATLKEARRECSQCTYRDVALIEPEKIIEVFVVSTTTQPAPTTTNTVS